MKKALKNNYIDQGTEMAASYFDNEAMKTFSVYVFCFARTSWRGPNGIKTVSVQGTMIDYESPYIHHRKYIRSID